jgi:hypothetical protein
VTLFVVPVRSMPVSRLVSPVAVSFIVAKNTSSAAIATRHGRGAMLGTIISAARGYAVANRLAPLRALYFKEMGLARLKSLVRARLGTIISRAFARLMMVGATGIEPVTPPV